MVENLSGDDDFDDFNDEGLLIDSFTPSESVMNDLLSNTGNTTILRFGDCSEIIGDCNMILTLFVEFCV